MIVDYLDFTDRQDRLQRKLGQNHAGGIISYLAYRLDRSNELVVIKQFCFLQADANC